MKCKTIQVISNDDKYILPLRQILTKKERMTLPEAAIVAEAVKHVSAEELAEIEIPFKENQTAVFCYIMDFVPEPVSRLNAVCQHTGDVWKCLAVYLKDHGNHLTTSQKKTIVKVFESFPVEDFEANLCLSSRKAEVIIRMLERLSYNRFSRSDAHKEAVRKLRNGELRSWNSRMEYLLSNDGAKALDFIAQRPGMMLRMVARLVRMGYDSDEILDRLDCASLSMQTLITVENFFSMKKIYDEREEAPIVEEIILEALFSKMKSLTDVPFRGKKVYIDEGEYDFANSYVDMGNKSAEGGYVRSGLAFRIPENINRVRFFVYWNDDRRVDLDLHVDAKTTYGEDIHVGWNGGFKGHGLYFSGDITESDSAEFIDIDLAEDVSTAHFNIHSYRNNQPFSGIETCFVGMQAVSDIGENVELYDAKNCFFTHNLRSNTRWLNYGFINVPERYLMVSAKQKADIDTVNFTLTEYLEMLTEAQDATIVYDREDADVVLVMGKPNSDEEISILDNNFFCD